jgi:hypothetical protein
MALRPFARREKDLTIALDRPSGPYHPGDTIHVTVSYEPRRDATVRELRVALASWEVYISEDSEGHTTRRTLTDATIGEEIAPVADVVGAGSTLGYEAEWRIPPDIAPPYAGDSLKCGLSVRATVDVARGRDASESLVVPLVVAPPGERVVAGLYGDASHPDTADMHLWLPSLEFVEGEAIHGRLSVVAGQSIDARSVRVGLVRRERVHAPRLKTTATQQVSSDEPAGRTRLDEQQQVEIPFTLRIPAGGCPSRKTELTTVSYTLEAALTRRFRKNYRVEARVFLYNGRRR